MGYILLVVALIIIIFIAGAKNTKLRDQLRNDEPDAQPSMPDEEPTHRTMELSVAGIHERNEAGEDIQEVLRRIGGQYKDNHHPDTDEDLGFKDVVRLVPDPGNLDDPHSIKVFLMDTSMKWHHVGFVKREDRRKVGKLLERDSIDGSYAQITGHTHRGTGYDVITEQRGISTTELDRGLRVILVI
ncbi:hypothetical protein [Bhargavaea cecembensis]|uniref:hypothetical protein n=1 Tax=Bhargavaea cecembensis TaxID=394098 RepID=UPI00058BB1D4|nr:hypothetical protein [Bhargavaea cecembensis]